MNAFSKGQFERNRFRGMRGGNAGRRGFAMLLVIISLAVITVSTSAFLAGRAVRPEISANVGRATNARAAAETALDMTLSIIKKDSIDWRSKVVNGKIIDGKTVGDCQVHAFVLDDDGTFPDADSRKLLVICVAVCGNLTQSVAAKLSVPPSVADVDVDLSEFAVFGSDQIQLRDNSHIIPWRAAPSPVEHPTKIGVNNLDAGAIGLRQMVNISNGAYYVRSGSSPFTISNLSGMLVPPRRVTISESDAIPLPDAPMPDISGIPQAAVYNQSRSSAEFSISESREFGDYIISDTANVTVNGAGVMLVITGNLDLLSGGDIFIAAPNVRIVVLGQLYIDRWSTLHVEDGASLELYANMLTVNNGVIGLPDEVAMNDSRIGIDGISTYFDPMKCKLYRIPGLPVQTWTIRNKGFVRGVIYAPNTYVNIENDSAVFGNVVAEDVYVKTDSCVHYDPALDLGLGFTNPDSLLYDADGQYDSDIQSALVDLSDATLTAIGACVATAAEDPTRDSWKDVTREMLTIGSDLDGAITAEEQRLIDILNAVLVSVKEGTPLNLP